MSQSAQSKLFWGDRTKAPGASSNPNATPAERAAELGIELEPVNPGLEAIATRHVVTKPIVNPLPDRRGGRDLLEHPLAVAEQLVRQREALHLQAMQKLDEARRARIVDPDSEQLLTQLSAARANADLRHEDAEAARGHRDQLRATLDAAKQDGRAQAFVDAFEGQTREAFATKMAPHAEAAGKLGAALGELAVRARSVIDEINRSSFTMRGLADELGIDLERARSNIHVNDAMFFIARAFLAGFRSTAPRERDSFQRWTGANL